MPTIPAFVQRGSTQDVEFVGYGLKTGTAKLESVRRNTQVPVDTHDVFRGEVEVAGETKLRYEIPTSDIQEVVEQQSDTDLPKPIQELSGPGAVTGVLGERYGSDRYRALGAKGN